MRRSIPAVLVVVVGLLLLVDFVLVNPTVASLASGAQELIVLLAAAAALAGAATLVLRHWLDLSERRRDPLGSGVLLAGFAVMMVAGLYPGSAGASDPAVRWLVAALLAPLVAALFAMLFVFVLSTARTGVALRTRQAAVMLAAAAVVVVLLLPIGGSLGQSLAALAGWAFDVPIGGVFRGLLIGVATLTAVHAARILLTVDRADE
ncbi:MAG TPA: hypothetical protein VIC83_09160 [Candidatus Limnocylindria bacterium]|jgi:hypothetical protein